MLYNNKTIAYEMIFVISIILFIIPINFAQASNYLVHPDEIITYTPVSIKHNSSEEKLFFDGMNYFKVSATSMIAMISRDNPLAQQDIVTLNDLVDYPLIVLENDEYSASLTQQYLRANNIHFPETVFADNIETVPWSIRSTGGIHITGESVRRQSSSSVAYIPIIAKDPGMTFGFVCADGNDNPIVSVFFKALKEFRKNL